MRIVLREELISEDSRFLVAEIKDNGDLVFKGLDCGKGVEEILGC
jgi:hypothetical protein